MKVFITLLSILFFSYYSHAGCTLSANVSVNNNVYCYGDSNGSATAVAIGGKKPYTYSWTPYGGAKDTAANLAYGSYTVTVTDSIGCIATATVFISQPARLNVSVTAISSPTCPTCCDGKATSNVTGGTIPFTGKWCNGSWFFTKDTTICASVTCYCCIMDANGCYSCDSIDMTAPTSINELYQTNSIKVYPNPSTGIFTFQYSANSAKSSVKVYNMLGEKVYNEALRQAQGDNTINLSGQSAGIYLYRIVSEQGEAIASGKLVIE